MFEFRLRAQLAQALHGLALPGLAGLVLRVRADPRLELLPQFGEFLENLLVPLLLSRSDAEREKPEHGGNQNRRHDPKQISWTEKSGRRARRRGWLRLY